MKTINLPNINLIKLRKIIIWVFLTAFIFSSGYVLGRKGFIAQFTDISQVKLLRETPPDKNVDFSAFWKVWDTLAVSYFDKTKLVPSEMIYGAIKGMVSAVGDPYTVYLPPQENKVVQEDLQGSFQGVGIQIGFKGTQLAVIAPLPNSPAEEAGIKAGDFIVGIKDEKKGIDMGTVGINLPDAVEAIRGPAGSKVTLALLRDGTNDPFLVDITRKEINVPSVILSLVSNDSIAQIRLLKFAGETNGEWQKTVNAIVGDPNIKGMILDLRNNPGGYLQGAVDVAGDFLPNSTLVVYEETASGEKNEFRTERLPRLAKIPLVVLINKGSASASEILAGALRDQADIKIIGETSFGKGTIQEPRQLENGAGLHITTAKWLTPKSFWVNDKGLEPDIKVEDNLETSDDEQLQEAISQLVK